MVKKKYLIWPDLIESKTDGDIHFINARTLMRLYAVEPSECLIVSAHVTNSCGIPKVEHNMRSINAWGLIVLRPRFKGDYREHLENLENKQKESGSGDSSC
jgi:hypothetical protein